MDKASKRASNNGMDRLSALPDAIICHILSFLDTKYAVATSILSTRWKNLCLVVPNIVFDHSLTSKKRTKKFVSDFARFALRQMMLRNVPYIDRFRLKCNFNFKDPLIKTLVCAAIWRNVKELDICLRGCPRTGMPLPSEVFSSRSLVMLKLKGEFALDIPELVYLPNLKVLVLGKIILGNDLDPLKRLFEGCKVLEDLFLSYSMIPRHADVGDLSIPSLRKLTIRAGLGGFKWAVDTPNLEVFECIGTVIHVQLVNELRFLSRATISASFLKDCKDMYQLINKMHGVKSLLLSPISQWAFDSSNYPLNVLEDLTHLKLHISYLQALASILGSTPQLEELVMIFVRSEGEGIVEDSWPRPKVVPECFAKLKNIDFNCYLTRESEFELVKYFLLNGKVLERMKFRIGRARPAQDVLAAYNRISMFPKCSKKCEIVFVS